LRTVQLLPENQLAWELYHEARLEGVGPLILELRQIELSPFEAEELAYKFEVIGSTYLEIQMDEAKKKPPGG